MSTTPSGVENVAPTGQTFTHGAFWHCWQGVGTNCVPPPGSAGSYTWIHSIGSGAKCPSMQAAVHCGGFPTDWQPSQERRSITIVQRRTRCPEPASAGLVL